MALEFLYRTLPGPWHHNLWLYGPLQLMVGYCVYLLVTMPGVTLLDSLVVFAGCTATLRIAASLALDDTVRADTWAAFALVMLANVVRVVWRQ